MINLDDRLRVSDGIVNPWSVLRVKAQSREEQEKWAKTGLMHGLEIVNGKRLSADFAELTDKGFQDYRLYTR
jgi:hypothetical protein